MNGRKTAVENRARNAWHLRKHGNAEDSEYLSRGTLLGARRTGTLHIDRSVRVGGADRPVNWAACRVRGITAA